MAMLHAREFELVTLWVRLHAQRGGSAVSARLEATVDGERTVLFGAGPFATSDFGLPGPGQSLSTTTLGVSPELVRQLSEWNDAENEQHRPLWVHLIRPYGHLGMIPWESDLVPALNVPVLRLPDFIEPQRETTSAFDVAVVSSVPRGVGKGEIGSPELQDVVEALLQATTSRRVHVHVFADEESARSLTPNEDVTVHTARPKTRRQASRPGANPWFDWIESAMGGQALDAVHFLAHGVLGASGGLLALGPEPRDADAMGGVYSSASQIADFLTRIGAWSAGFHLPRRRDTDLGLRQVADAIGATRPGSVLFHDPLVDRDVLGPAMRLLYGPEPQPAPVSPGYFAFIQPRRVEHAGGESHRPSRRRTMTGGDSWDDAAPAGYDSLFAQESLPSYVAAIERLGDMTQVALNKGYDTASGSPLGEEESEALTRAMTALKSVVATYAVETETNTRSGDSRKGRRS